ncbi:ATP-binding protein [Candidatus Woesearchaeota archaeon]|nr:ATP-binding protein [Candidatus Woesearchaeota archaeon]
MAQIKDALLDFNPWWKEDLKVNFKDREIYGEIAKFMPLPQIIAFIGLRRVGKTTLMLKIAEDFLSKGNNPKNVLYFSFDEFKEVRVRDVLAEYEKVTEIELRNGKLLLLLDEIQKLADWESQLKAIYDVFGKNMKILISGSESLTIRRKSKETLAGRLFEFKIEPLTFSEFLDFKEVNLKPAGVYEKELARLFEEFTLTGGLPELVGVKDKEIIKKYVSESVVEKVIYRDLAILVKIGDLSALESLLRIFTEEPGQLVDVSELAMELKVSRQTISNYLGYLEESFLLRKLYNFSRNIRKSVRRLKKYYPTLPSAELLFKNDNLSRSKVFECVAINQLRPKFFWRDPYKNEVDNVITDKEGNPVPVEIKYGKISINGLLAFMKKFKVAKGYIISKESEYSQSFNGKTVHVIPAFKLFSSKAAASAIKQEK